MTAVSGRPYPLDNTHQIAADHHRALADLLDPTSQARIVGLKGGWLDGARCLEIGAGGGSMTRWLVEQVGRTGHVIACDLDPHLVRRHPRIRVLGADVSLPPEQWPPHLDGPFDLVYSRLTLAHLPARDRITSALVHRLAPAGALLIEDWAAYRTGVVVTAPDPAAAELYERYQLLVSRTFAEAGTDQQWAERMHHVLRANGLARVATLISGGYWTAGGPGLRLVAAVAAQLQPQLRSGGMSDADLDRLRRLLGDERLVIRGHPLYSTSGVAPGG